MTLPMHSREENSCGHSSYSLGSLSEPSNHTVEPTIDNLHHCSNPLINRWGQQHVNHHTPIVKAAKQAALDNQYVRS